MNLLQQLLDKTEELINYLQKTPSEEEREAYIAHIEKLLDQRESLIQQLNGGYTEEEKVIGHKIVQLNQEVDALMKDFFTTLQDNLRKLKHNKKVYQRYNQYQPTADGMFFDKRK